MKAKPSLLGAQGIHPDQAPAIGVPAGAVVATELVFQQLAYEAEVMSIVRTARLPREGAEA